MKIRIFSVILIMFFIMFVNLEALDLPSRILGNFFSYSNKDLAKEIIFKASCLFKRAISNIENKKRKEEKEKGLRGFFIKFLTGKW